MLLYFGKPTIMLQILKSIICLYMKVDSCIIQRHQALEYRLPGPLLQMVFSNAVKPQGCISWPLWPLRGINRTAWDAILLLTIGLAYLNCKLCQPRLPINGTTLPFVSEWFHYPTFSSARTCPHLLFHPPPGCPLPI